MKTCGEYFQCESHLLSEHPLGMVAGMALTYEQCDRAQTEFNSERTSKCSRGKKQDLSSHPRGCQCTDLYIQAHIEMYDRTAGPAQQACSAGRAPEPGQDFIVLMLC